MRFMLRNLVILCIVISAVTALAVNASAQDPQDTSGGKSVLLNAKNPIKSLKSVSLLDPERFTMRNQYMMSFSSVGGSGSLMGMYVNTMEYRFNCPLIMRVKLAYQSQTGRLFGNKDAFTGNPNLEQGQMYIPSFDLVYKPWKNTTISFHYRDYRGNNPYSGYGGYGYNSRYRRYGYSPFTAW